MTSRVGLLEKQTGIDAAESERIRQYHIDRRGAGLVRDVVEVALRIGMVQVDRGRQDAVMNGQDAEDGFDASGNIQGWVAVVPEPSLALPVAVMGITFLHRRQRRRLAR